MFQRSLVFLLLLIASHANAELFLRLNNFAYIPTQPKILVVMAESDQKGREWYVKDEKGAEQLSGFFTQSVAGKTNHTAKPHNYMVDVSDLKKEGTYYFSVGDKRLGSFRIQADPYPAVAQDMIRHLKVVRSGTEDTLLHPASHMKDSEAWVYRPDGDLKKGRWKQDKGRKKLDLRGGWYDAGDYMKFTLTIAYTTYYLLRAYEENPKFFTKYHSKSAFVDILDEAKFGLDFLVKTYPEKDEFIIQVSTALDHEEGKRLPQNDKRDGKREALSAISPAQMGFTSAALALGSNIFKKEGEDALAKIYGDQAIKIYARSQADDALPQTAFERKNINDLYPDKDVNDNLALAAIELYLLTGEAGYLKAAKKFSARAGSGWTSWCCVAISADYRLARFDKSAKKRFLRELKGYSSYGKDEGDIWGIPMQPTWSPLIGQAAVAAYGGLATKLGADQYQALLWDNLDYIFGRNNWGVAFIVSETIPRSVRNVYNQIYKLLKVPGIGAVALGPGARDQYENLKQHFTPSRHDKVFDEFNTKIQIFYDNDTMFQTMETTIASQATMLYLLAVASK